MNLLSELQANCLQDIENAIDNLIVNNFSIDSKYNFWKSIDTYLPSNKYNFIESAIYDKCEMSFIKNEKPISLYLFRK